MQESQDGIREGNRIIAEFMGGKEIYDAPDGWIKNVQGLPDNQDRFELVNGKYHSSWDWIVPALKSAKEKIKKTDWSTTLEKEADKRLRAALNEVYNLNIENAHYCFVKFIEWFNQQKR